MITNNLQLTTKMSYVCILPPRVVMDSLQRMAGMDKFSPTVDLSGMWTVGCGSKDK